MSEFRSRGEGPFPVALVSGASSGIGAATVRRLSVAGYRVGAAVRRAHRPRGLGAGVGAGRARAARVTDAAAVAALPVMLPEGWREIAILVNAAGQDVGGGVDFVAGDIEDAIRTVEANLSGLMRLTHAVGRGMAERGRGDIVNIGSITAWQASPTIAAYAASKHGVNGLSKALRAEFGGSGVRVIEIMPGVVETGFAEARWRGDGERAQAFYAGFAGRLSPDDVAGAVLWAVGQPPEVQVDEIRLSPTLSRPG